jgi:hypothetical protein
MRTSYLRPSSRPRRRYQDSTPRGAEAEGNWTGSRASRIGLCEGERASRRRVSRVGGSLGKATGRGPRKMVFSTLAFTVQTCVTMQQSQAMTRIFGGQCRSSAGNGAGTNSFSHVHRAIPLDSVRRLGLVFRRGDNGDAVCAESSRRQRLPAARTTRLFSTIFSRCAHFNDNNTPRSTTPRLHSTTATYSAKRPGTLL